jgi:hypothetical protein
MLSKTTEGKNWLQQFDEEDKEIATIFLDSVFVVSHSELEACLVSRLNEFLSLNKRGKIALYAVKERPKILPRKIAIDKTKPFFPLAISHENPKRKPIDYSTPGETGSEGEMEHLCRDYKKSRSRVLTNPGLEELREKRVRWIILLDDIIGSGNRIKEYLEWLYEDKTIKSWHSYGLIDFHVIAYVSTSEGKDHIEKIKYLSDINSCRHITSGISIWTDKELEKIELLCVKYSKKYSLGHPFGYKDAFSMILLPYGFPNTAPSILSEQKNGWRKLFPETGRPSICIEKLATLNEKRQERLLLMLGQTRLTKPSLFSRLNKDSKNLLMLLAAIASKKRDVIKLSEILATSESTINEWCSKCRYYGWIDEKNFLTLHGKKTLEAARKNKCTLEYEFSDKDKFYFPMSLKGASETV